MNAFFSKNVLAFLVTTLFSIQCFAQVFPASIGSPVVWIKDGNIPSFFGNYKSVDKTVIDSLISSGLSDVEIKDVSFFIVVKPNFDSTQSNSFFRFGALELFDDTIQVKSFRRAIALEGKEPIILSAQFPNRGSFGRLMNMDFNWSDSSLFDIAEVIIYPAKLKDIEVRQVETYLSLKYSCTTTTFNSRISNRSYVSSDTAQYYWDISKDLIFNKRVIGVGKDSLGGIIQTQTRTNDGNWIQLSIDSVAPLGEMPNTFIEDSSFIVFSELRDSKIINNCNITGVHPLSKWKFKRINWNRNQQVLKIRVSWSGASNDSVWVYNNLSNRIYLPGSYVDDSTYEYNLNLSYFQNDFSYYFDSKKSTSIPCATISLDTTYGANLLSVHVNPEITGTSSIRIIDQSDGWDYSDRLKNGQWNSTLEEGIYEIAVLDSSQAVLSFKNIAVTGTTLNSDLLNLLVVPNPTLVNQKMGLLLHSPTSGSGQLYLIDGFGHVLDSKPVDFISGLTSLSEFEVTVSGLYYVLFTSGSQTISLKVVVINTPK